MECCFLGKHPPYILLWKACTSKSTINKTEHTIWDPRPDMRPTFLNPQNPLTAHHCPLLLPGFLVPSLPSFGITGSKPPRQLARPCAFLRHRKNLLQISLVFIYLLACVHCSIWKVRLKKDQLWLAFLNERLPKSKHMGYKKGNIFVHHNPMGIFIIFFTTWHVSIDITIFNSLFCIYRTMIMSINTCQLLRMMIIVQLELKWWAKMHKKISNKSIHKINWLLKFI